MSRNANPPQATHTDGETDGKSSVTDMQDLKPVQRSTANTRSDETPALVDAVQEDGEVIASLFARYPSSVRRIVYSEQQTTLIWKDNSRPLHRERIWLLMDIEWRVT